MKDRAQSRVRWLGLCGCTMSALLLGMAQLGSIAGPNAGDIVYVRGARYDADMGVYLYELPQPALVRVRYGIKMGCLLYTPVDWEIQGAGTNDVPFKFDVGGKSAGLGPRQVKATIMTCAVPDDPGRAARSPAATFERLKVLSHGQKAESANVDPNVRSISPFWKNGLRKEPAFEAEFADAARDAEGTYGLPERSQVRIHVAAGDVERFAVPGGEVVVYVDFKFHSEEEAFTPDRPFTLDLSRVPPGEHIVTFNLRDPYSNLGARSYRFRR